MWSARPNLKSLLNNIPVGIALWTYRSFLLFRRIKEEDYRKVKAVLSGKIWFVAANDFWSSVSTLG